MNHIDRHRAILNAKDAGHITSDECHTELIIMRHRWEMRMQPMLEMAKYRRAQRDRVCPICWGKLAWKVDDTGNHLYCINGHEVTDIQEAPLRWRVYQMGGEARRMVTAQ